MLGVVAYRDGSWPPRPRYGPAVSSLRLGTSGPSVRAPIDSAIQSLDVGHPGRRRARVALTFTPANGVAPETITLTLSTINGTVISSRHRRLAPGSYTLTVTDTAGGRTSAVQSLDLTIGSAASASRMVGAEWVGMTLRR